MTEEQFLIIYKYIMRVQINTAWQIHFIENLCDSWYTPMGISPVETDYSIIVDAFCYYRHSE